jgi:hypothetical protein
MTNRNGETASGRGATAADSDDWESMLDSGQLDKSLEKLTVKPTGVCPQQPQLQAAAAGGNKMEATAGNSGSSSAARPLLDDPFFSGPVRILTHDGSAARTQYRPPEPQLKILKRPTSDTALVKKASESQQAVKIGAAIKILQKYLVLQYRSVANPDPDSGIGSGYLPS